MDCTSCILLDTDQVPSTVVVSLSTPGSERAPFQIYASPRSYQILIFTNLMSLKWYPF